MTGIELALPVLAHLVQRGDLDWPTAVDYVTRKPADTLHLPGGRLVDGAPADITIIDPQAAWVVSRDTLRSRSANTPMLGMTVRGRARLTICNGEVLHDEFPAN
jgi:dihydroorotase